MVLFLGKDFAKQFGHGVFLKVFALMNALAVILDGGNFVGEIGAQHLFVVVGDFHRLGLHSGRAAQVVDLLGDGKGVLKFFAGVLFEFAGDVHILSTLQNFRIGDVGDDGLVFAGQIFV